MAHVIVAMALSLVLAQDPPAQDKAGPDLDAALGKAALMDNYTAGIMVRKEGASDPGKAEGLAPVEVRVMPGSALHLKSGELEGYRKGDVLVVQEGGLWKRFEPSGDKGAGEADKLAHVLAPHEILRDLKSTSFKHVRREDTEGGRVFSGALTDDAIKKLMTHKPPGAAGEKALPSAAAKFWVNGEGLVTKYELTFEFKAEPGKTDGVALKKTKTIEFRDIGSTKYEVPAEALKAMGGEK